MNRKLTNLLRLISTSPKSSFEIMILWESRSFWNYFRPVKWLLNDLVRNKYVLINEGKINYYEISLKGIKYLESVKNKW